MKLTNWLSSPMAEALGWTLIHALWQGFAVVLVIAVLLHIVRRSQSALRYQIGMSGLFMQVLVSLGTFAWYYEPRSLAGPVTAAPSISNVPTTLLNTTNESWLVGMQAFLHAHLTEVVWLWLIGVGIFGIRLLGGWAYVQRLRHTATLPVPAMLSAATDKICRKLNVSARVHVTARITGPLVVGTLKPVILWPVGLLAGLSAADVEAILAHELAHIQRHDYLLNVAQSVVEALYFFHPALWWLSARVREEREHCCDDLAVSVISDARILARALARVEEWQRGIATTPTLAMAFASKRQLLLQRVRRMLGVPTSPLVSNSSLAGLTLFTLLLVSISVYAVQQADQAKPASRVTNQNPSPANRRHRIDATSEIGMSNFGKLSYIIWKGQKLTTARVVTLQHQLDLVMAGKLSLDVVKPPSRDILQTIIEKNQAFGAGMTALANGLAHIDLTNIEVVPTVNVPVIPEIPEIDVPEVSPVVAGDTSRLRAVQQQLELLMKQMQALMAERQPVADKLSKEMAELAAKNGDYQKQLNPYMGQIGQLAKQQRALAAKMLALQRETQTLSRQNSAKAKALLQQREAQADQLEKQIDELDAKMEKLNTNLEPLNARLEPYHQRMEVLADSIEKLYEPTNALSEKIGELSAQFSEQAERQAEEAMRQAEEITSGRHHVIKGDTIYYFPSTRAPRPARPAQPSRLPRPAKAPRAPRPAVNSVNAVPVPSPAAAPSPARAPAVIPKPATAPKAPR